MKKLNAVWMMVLVALTLTACTDLFTPPGDMAETNKEIVRRFIDAMNTRQLDLLDDVVAADVVRHSQATPHLQVRSLAEFKAMLQNDFVTFPDVVQIVEMMVAEDDMVSLYATFSGTQDGPMGDIPASGKKVDLKFMGMLRLENGKIQEIWVEWDNVTILTQLGLFPPPQ